MDRKQFLRGCATSLCACAAACLPSAAAEPAKPEDWRLPFVKQRYAKLISMLSERMDEKTLAKTLEDLGGFCASQRDEKTEAFRGKPDAFIAEIAKYGSSVTRNGESFTVAYDPKGDCFCPLNGLAAKTPGTACQCSVGWTRHTWSIVLGKEAKVALLESVLQGGKVCKFAVTAA